MDIENLSIHDAIARAYEIGFEAKKAVAIYSPFNQYDTKLSITQMLLAKVAGVPITKLLAYDMSDAEYASIVLATELLAPCKLYINDTKELSLKEITDGIESSGASVDLIIIITA